MWLPSTSASHIITILWYLSLLKLSSRGSSSVPIVTPSAVYILFISSFSKTLCCMAFSTFKIFPLNGRIAWKFLSRPCLAVPPAESPSTKKISHFSGSFQAQSDSLPGSPPPDITVFLWTISLAFVAACLAWAARITFWTIIFASSGFSSR